MKIYIALKIKNEIIGTKRQETAQYISYLRAKYEFEKAFEDGDMGWVFTDAPVKPEVQYETVPFSRNIPRIIEISQFDLREKYKDEVLSHEHPFGDVFVECIDINEEYTSGMHYAQAFSDVYVKPILFEYNPTPSSN